MNINRILSGFYLIICVFLSSCGGGSKPDGDSSDEKGQDTALYRINELDELISENSSDPDLYHKRSILYIKRSEFQKALDDVQVAIGLDSLKAEYYLTLADISFAGNRIYKAQDALEKAVELQDDNNEAKLKLAEIYLILREYRTSVTYLNEIIASDVKNLTAWFMRGMNYKEVGDTAQAIRDFQRILEIDPRYYNAVMQLGVIMQAMNNPAAEEYFTNAIELRAESEEALYGRGLWYQDHGELNKAIEDYTKIIDINPMNKNAHFNLGYIHQIDLNLFDVAIKHYSDALKADAQYTEAYYNRGLCYEALGNIEGAYADYSAALTLRTEYPLAEEALKRVSE